jgi:5-methyltetrahydrofolate--homocysteine methyltransferase
MSEILNTIQQGIIEGNAGLVAEKVQEALDADLAPGQILHEGLVPAMAEVGRLYEEGEYFVPEMLIAARAMKQGLAILKPLLIDSKVEPVGTVALATVKGDLHDIGKNLVSLMLEGAGFEIVDLGVDAGPEKFIEAVRDNSVNVVAMSALLTTTMVHMRDTIEALEDAGLREQVKVIIGGAPITQAFADEIGADGYAPDASQAVTLAKSLIGAM